jgi:hypothetical protein
MAYSPAQIAQGSRAWYDSDNTYFVYSVHYDKVNNKRNIL